MKNALTRFGAAAALCGATLVAAPQEAHAYDVNGIGVGADLTVGGLSGLALTVGLGRFELDFIVGMSLDLPDNGVLEPDFGGAVGFFYTLTDAETTNFQLGGRVGTIIDSANRPSGLGGSELVTYAGITLEADLRLEHRLDDHCVINFQAGVVTAIWPGDSPRADFSMGIGGTGLVGGAGFRYYFDGLGGGSSASSASSAEPRRASSASASSSSSSGSSSGGSSASAETPYWEQ